MHTQDKNLMPGIHAVKPTEWKQVEPDHLDFKPSDMDNKIFLGSFRKVRNAFPLLMVGGVYDHQLSVSDSKRVFILTRSAFAGQQRYGANTWSGYVTSSWSPLRNQVSAGLNFSLTGIPYWDSDIGGFFLSRFRRKLEDTEYRELYVRWLEFGTFCPLMRSHGADAPREIYQFGIKGDKVYDAVEKYINLRYRFLPYIYATSRDVTANQSSMMRALASIPERTGNLYCTKMRTTITILRKEFIQLLVSIGMIKRKCYLLMRIGSFPGMLNERKFNLVLVGINKGIRENEVNQPDKVILIQEKNS